MFCPQCGQQQATGVIRFCSRCGFPLDGVIQLLSTGGMVPVYRNPDEPVPVSERRKGVKQGGLLLLLGAVLVPLLGVISEFSNAAFPQILMAFAALLNSEITPRRGTSTAPSRSNSPPCFTPFRRSETGTGSSGLRYTGTIPPVLSS